MPLMLLLGVLSANEPYYYQQWYLDYDDAFYSDNDIDKNAHIHAHNALNRYNGEGVTVAIIDDGLDVAHQEINGSIVATYDIDTNSSDVSQNSSSDHHGTAITGIIASDINGKGIAGIANKSNIVFLKYKESMSDSETIELFNKAADMGADVINCSWGTYDVSDSVKETIQRLSNEGRDGKGIVFVFAVGNDDQDVGNDESAIPEVIAVGATNRENLRAWYSNYGNEVDVVAPGGYEVGIATIDPVGQNGYSDNDYLLATDTNAFIGTSASAPIVTGVIALMLQKNPDLTRAEVENRLRSTADKIGNDEYVNGRNDYYGYGKLNADRVLGTENDNRLKFLPAVLKYLLD